jgi:hypothetical protein
MAMRKAEVVVVLRRLELQAGACAGMVEAGLTLSDPNWVDTTEGLGLKQFLVGDFSVTYLASRVPVAAASDPRFVSAKHEAKAQMKNGEPK